MSQINDIFDWCEFSGANTDFVRLDGFDDAILGHTAAWCANGELGIRLIYSVPKCIEIICKNMGMDEEEATEYFDTNIDAHYGDYCTPIFCISFQHISIDTAVS